MENSKNKLKKIAKRNLKKDISNILYIILFIAFIWIGLMIIASENIIGFIIYTVFVVLIISQSKKKKDAWRKKIDSFFVHILKEDFDKL